MQVIWRAALEDVDPWVVRHPTPIHTSIRSKAFQRVPLTNTRSVELPSGRFKAYKRSIPLPQRLFYNSISNLSLVSVDSINQGLPFGASLIDFVHNSLRSQPLTMSDPGDPVNIANPGPKHPHTRKDTSDLSCVASS
jgi:hypothetical protein